MQKCFTGIRQKPYAPQIVFFTLFHPKKTPFSGKNRSALFQNNTRKSKIGLFPGKLGFERKVTFLITGEKKCFYWNQ